MYFSPMCAESDDPHAQNVAAPVAAAEKRVRCQKPNADPAPKPALLVLNIVQFQRGQSPEIKTPLVYPVAYDHQHPTAGRFLSRCRHTASSTQNL